MNPLISRWLTGAVALMVAAPSLIAEEAPAGAREKIAAALPDAPFVKPLKERKLLVFSRTDGFRHPSIATGKIAMEEMARKTGAFTPVFTEELDEFEVDRLKTYDAVCFLNSTMNVFLPYKNDFQNMSPEAKAEAVKRQTRLQGNLMQFIKSGRGYVGIHAATDCCYEWPEYGEMVNGYFDGHPWTADSMVSVKVEPGQEKHPLVAMFEGKNVEFAEEIYQLKDPYHSASVHMLLRLDTEKTDMNKKGINRKDGDFGIAWIRPWEKGRVFYCSLGHNHDMYWHNKVIRHYLAGIQWALGDYQVEVKTGK